MFGLQPQMQNMLVLVLLFCLLVTSSVFVGGISSQATYSPSKVCLLFIENYQNTGARNTFNAYSTTCQSAISIGGISIFLTLVVAAVRGWFMYKQEAPSSTVVLILAVIATIWALASFIMAAVVSAGINSTCKQMESVTGYSCAAVFNNGFYVVQYNETYSQNLNTVNAAVGAGWVEFLLWSIYAGYEWFNYKVHARKWW